MLWKTGSGEGRWLNVLSPTFEIARPSIFAHLLIPIKPIELFSWCQVEFRTFSGANFGDEPLVVVYRLLVECSVLQVRQGVPSPWGFAGTEIVPFGMQSHGVWWEMAGYPSSAASTLLGNHSQVRSRQPKCRVPIILAQPWITAPFKISCVFIADKSIIFNLYSNSLKLWEFFKDLWRLATLFWDLKDNALPRLPGWGINCRCVTLRSLGDRLCSHRTHIPVLTEQKWAGLQQLRTGWDSEAKTSHKKTKLNCFLLRRSSN